MTSTAVSAQTDSVATWIGAIGGLVGAIGTVAAVIVALWLARRDRRDQQDDARTIGARCRQIRLARDKTLRVIAGLAGMSTTHLWRIEHGERALALSEIAALADALQIAPSELIKLPIPAPANGDTDSAIKAVRRALRAVSHGRPGGQVMPVKTLRARVTAAVAAHTRCDREDQVGAALPALIADLHTSIMAGRDVAELLDLAVFLHVGATTGWLRVAGAEVDLREQAGPSTWRRRGN